MRMMWWKPICLNEGVEERRVLWEPSNSFFYDFELFLIARGDPSGFFLAIFDP